MYKYNRDVAEQVGFIPHLWRTQRLPDEDDAPLWWEEFRLLVPLGNVGRLYTGSSRPSASSFLSRISDSSDPALRTLGPLIPLIVVDRLTYPHRLVLKSLPRSCRP